MGSQVQGQYFLPAQPWGWAVGAALVLTGPSLELSPPLAFRQCPACPSVREAWSTRCLLLCDPGSPCSSHPTSVLLHVMRTAFKRTDDICIYESFCTPRVRAGTYPGPWAGQCALLSLPSRSQTRAQGPRGLPWGHKCPQAPSPFPATCGQAAEDPQE